MPDSGADAAGVHELERLRAVIDQFPAPAAVLEGPEHVIVAASGAYSRVVGGRPLIGRRIAEAVPELVPQGFVARLDRVYQTGEAAHAEGVSVELKGEGGADHAVVDYTYQPLRAPDGSVWGVLAHVTDVTARHQAEAEREFIASASEVLASSLDYQATLSSVTRLAVPVLADWCAIDELAPDGTVRRISVAHPDPDKVELARRLHEMYPPDPQAQQGVIHVLRTGEPEMMEEIPDALLVAAARDEEHLAVARALGLRSYVCVPLVARGTILGALSLVSAESGRRYTPRDLALAKEVARRAAVAIDNARLYSETEQARHRLEEQTVELESQSEELQVQASQLQEVAAELEMRNDELQQANRELEDAIARAEHARAAADEANQAKTAFLATMSHELRTPLNAIGGYVELLGLGIHGPVTDAQAETLDRVRRNQQRLLGLINDVLNFARVDAGQVQYRIARVPVDEMLQGMQALVDPQVRARGLVYTYRGGSGDDAAWADRERVEQIVLNLLSNAVKFTPAGGEVSLGWEDGGDAVRIHVRDTGRGIPAEKLDVIFEPFVQVDPSLTRENEGTGLGLAISRDLARSMGGDLAAESRMGEGSVFTLTLPRAG